MAHTGIHFDGTDDGTPRFEVHCVKHDVQYSFIAVTVATGSTLYLPNGPQSPVVARALAAVLLEAADQFDRAAAESS
jgi:hypothetical protein